LALWIEWLASKGIVKSGAKEINQTRDRSHPVTMEHLQTIFEPGALESLMAAWEGDYRALLDWWRTRVTGDFRKRIQFPADVAAARGLRALIDPPKVVVGTIHSVKGGQADVVYLFPDLSQAGDAQYNRGGDARDSVIRIFYVGLTRARETLYICQRETCMAATI
jgi:superfamily I DNA/RNA helicase